MAAIADEGGTKLFAATGFVGQLNGQLALLTHGEYPAVPRHSQSCRLPTRSAGSLTPTDS